MGEWRLIDTAPKDEIGSFLIFTLCAGKEPVVVQVSRFEGRLYPDFLGSAIDREDAMTRATHWMPLPPPPKEARASTERGEATPGEGTDA
jgi:hypothetical protein